MRCTRPEHRHDREGRLRSRCVSFSHVTSDVELTGGTMTIVRHHFEMSDTPLTDEAEQALYASGVDRHHDGTMMAKQSRVVERKLNMANMEIAAAIQGIVTAEKPTGDCTDLLDVVESFITHHKEVEAQRDALGLTRPFDVYWSRRALNAERDLAKLKEGLGLP